MLRIRVPGFRPHGMGFLREARRRSFYAGAHHARVLVADPPWEFNDALGSRGAAANYDVQESSWIERIMLPVMHPEGSLLFLWRVGAMVEEAYRVCRAWGFVPKSEIVWRKLTTKGNRSFGMGRYTRWEHESCIIAVRGRNPVINHGIRSTFDAPEPGCPHNLDSEYECDHCACAREQWEHYAGMFDAPMGRHSQKPEAFFDIVEELVGGLDNGPFVELFARRQRPGWHCYGNALGHDIR